MKLLYQCLKSAEKNIIRKRWFMMENNKLKYGDKTLYIEGVIVEVNDGSIGINLKGRLGYLKIPLRMLISDNEVKVGQEIGFNMSFIEQLSEDINDKYIQNINARNKR